MCNLQICVFYLLTVPCCIAFYIWWSPSVPIFSFVACAFGAKSRVMRICPFIFFQEFYTFSSFTCILDVYWVNLWYEVGVKQTSLVAQLVKNPPAMQETLIRLLGQAVPPGEGTGYPLQYSWASLAAQMVKNPPALQETWVWSLGWEDPMEEGMATHSSILAWRISSNRGAWRAMVYRVAKSQTWLSS